MVKTPASEEIMVRQGKLARKVVKTLLAQKGTYSAVGLFLRVNPAHIWKATNQGYTSRKLIYALARKGLIDRPPPKETRRRAWMRTDNLGLAVAQLCRHYPDVKCVVLRDNTIICPQE